MNINELVEQSLQVSIEHGFWKERASWPFDVRVVVAAALIGTETSEIIEAVRNKEGREAIGEEIADVMIRAADLAGYLGFDMDSIIEEKMEKNRRRPYLNGKVM